MKIAKLPLRKWFIVIYLIAANKKGIASHQLARDIKVTQKTAWFMLQRIRETFEPEYHDKFHDNVEIDETYRGKEKNKHKEKRTPNTQGRSTKTKTPVLGILERDGKVYAIPIADTKGQTITSIIKSKIKKGANIFTDEWESYRILVKEFNHKFVRHSADQCVDG